MELKEENIRAALKGVKYPGFTRDIVSFGIVKEVKVDDDAKVTLSARTPKPDPELESKIRESTEKAVLETAGVNGVDIQITSRAPKAPPGTVKRAGKGRAESKTLRHQALYRCSQR